MQWEAQHRASLNAAALVAALPDVRWGLNISDEDTRDSPSALNIYVETDEESRTVVVALQKLVPGKWLESRSEWNNPLFTEAWLQQIIGCLQVSIINTRKVDYDV